MKQPIVVEHDPKNEINYLGKIKKKIKKAHMISIIAVAVVVLSVITLFIKNHIIGELAALSDMKINWTYSEETDSIIVNGELLTGSSVGRVKVYSVNENNSFIRIKVYRVYSSMYTDKTFSVSIPWQDDIQIELQESNNLHRIADSWDIYPGMDLFQNNLWVKGGLLADKYALRKIKNILFDTAEAEIEFYENLGVFYHGFGSNTPPDVPEYIEILYGTDTISNSFGDGISLGVIVYVYEQGGTYYAKMADHTKEISIDDYKTLTGYLDSKNLLLR